jgi:hypothetical protein
VTRFSNLQKDLSRLAAFGLNIADAHSCFILVPPLAIARCSPLQSAANSEPNNNQPESHQFLEIGGICSLSQEVVENAKIFLDSGLIGWVAKHGKSIHVSPFEHDSRTLGVYSSDQQLKSFIGIPIAIGEPDFAGKTEHTGVIACDSKKSFAFSKVQGKLLEDLAREVANTISLHQRTALVATQQPCWDIFLESACALGHSLGVLSLEILRIHQNDFENLERAVGTMKAIELTRQAQRLIQQALPPLYPSLLLPNGDIIVALDTMMSTLIENKIRAVCQHLSAENYTIEFEFIKNPIRKRKERSVHLETLVVETATRTLTRIQGDEKLNYEYRRA